MVEHDLAEVIEIEVSAESPCIGRPFRERPLAGRDRRAPSSAASR